MTSKQAAPKGQQSLFSFFKKSASAPAAEPTAAAAPVIPAIIKPASPAVAALPKTSDIPIPANDASSKCRALVGKRVEVNGRSLECAVSY